jgi:hypothetical protein
MSEFVHLAYMKKYAKRLFAENLPAGNELSSGGY